MVLLFIVKAADSLNSKNEVLKSAKCFVMNPVNSKKKKMEGKRPVIM
jgi:hypothetical protein